MAKRRKKTTAPKRRRRNPSPRRAARKAGRRLAKSFMGLNVGSALKNVLPIQAGMWSAKFAANLGENATDNDPDSWVGMSYLKASMGALGAGILMNMVKPGSGQKALEGGLNYTIFKLFRNEIVPKSETAMEYLGEPQYEEDVVVLTGADDEPMMLDEGSGRMLPATDEWRDQQYSGGALEPVGRLGSYGDELQPVGPLGASAWDDMV